MRWTWILAAAPLLAQAPGDLFEKAPPAVDDALRARIQQFYQYHVEGKGRLAEALVAEESKDDFYNGNKPRCIKFEISRVDYSEKFARARATVVCTMYVAMIGFMDKPLPVPMTSLWKVVDGQWYWYAPPPSRETPFGTMRPGPNTGSAAMPAHALPEGKEVQALLEQVKVDRKALQFPYNKGGTERISITNAMQGKLTVSLGSLIPTGIEASLGGSEIPAGGSVVLTVKAAPVEAPRGPVTIEVSVQPTGQVIPIRIVWVR
jgi:hypothetical protein